MPHNVIIGVKLAIFCRGAKDQPVSFWLTNYVKGPFPTVTGSLVESKLTGFVSILKFAIHSSHELSSTPLGVGSLALKSPAFWLQASAKECRRFGLGGRRRTGVRVLCRPRFRDFCNRTSSNALTREGRTRLGLGWRRRHKLNNLFVRYCLHVFFP